MFQAFPRAGTLPAILPRATLAAFLLLKADRLEAARPLITDDAAVVPARACQLEGWGERSRAASALWLQPGCSPFAATELSFGFGWLTADRGERLGLRRVQLKQRLAEAGEEQVGFALALGGEWAPGRDLRERFLNAIATVPLAGEAERLHLNLGFSSSREAGERRAVLTWAAAFERVFGESRIALESYGASGERPGWQLGYAYEWLPGKLQLDASLGAEFGRFRERRVLTLGLVFFSEPFLP